MKKQARIRFCATLSALLLIGCSLLSAVSCASGSRLLYSIPDGDRVCEIYGNDGRPAYISVTQNGTQIWKKELKVKKSVGEQGGTYGFEVLDLNFDGRNDLKIAIDANGEQLTELYFLQTEDGSYQKTDLFSGLYTVGVNPGEQAIFSFSHTYQTGKAENNTEVYISTDTTTAYVWKDGVLKPYRRVSLTYYSAQDIYQYSVSDYSDVTNNFLDPDDKWLSPKEYLNADLSFLYYFRR